jgi:hypothetical protein
VGHRLKREQYILSLVFGVFICLISSYGFIMYQGRLDLPQEPEVKKMIQEGQPDIYLDGIKIENEKDLEFLLSQKRMHGELTVLFSLEGEAGKKEVSLVRYYSQVPFPLIYLVIGLIGLILGFIVFLLRPKERQARIFYWASLSFCSAIIISGGFHCLGKSGYSYLPGILFYLLYPLAPACLLHFALSFRRRLDRKTLVIIYVPALLFSLGLESTFMVSSLKSSIDIYRIYHAIFQVFRFYIVVFALASIVHLLLGLRKSSHEVPRAQIKWILYGLIIGLGPFILLYQIPQVFGFNPHSFLWLLPLLSSSSN